MRASTRWFGWTALMLPLHMSEQLIFGIGELATMRRVLAVYYRWFQQPDCGTMVLVTITGTLILSLIFAILVGDRSRPIAVGILNLAALGEVHHLMETIHAGHYTHGTATAILCVVFGILVLRALIREHREATGASAPRPAPAQAMV